MTDTPIAVTECLRHQIYVLIHKMCTIQKSVLPDPGTVTTEDSLTVFDFFDKNEPICIMTPSQFSDSARKADNSNQIIKYKPYEGTISIGIYHEYSDEAKCAVIRITRIMQRYHNLLHRAGIM